MILGEPGRSDELPRHPKLGSQTPGVLEPLLLVAQVYPQGAVAHVGPGLGTNRASRAKVVREGLMI